MAQQKRQNRARSRGKRRSDAGARLAAGIERQQAGDIAAAAEHYRAALAAEPGNIDALHLLGVASYLSKDFSTAVDLLEKARRLAPRNAEIASNLGAALHGAGNIAGAADAFRAAARLDPRNIGAHANLAAVLVQSGEPEAAIESFASAHRLDPTNPHFVKRLGELCLGAERYEEAAHWLKLCLKLLPDDADALGNAAFACDRLGHPSEAEAHYRRALALRPGVPETAYNLGALLTRTGRTDEAAKLFAHAFSAAPEAWRDPADHARALANNGDIVAALPIFETLAAARPNDAALLADYAKALIDTGDQTSAADVLEAALAAEAGRHDLRVKLAHCMLHAGRADAAIEFLKGVPETATEYLRAQLDLCMVLAGEKRHQEAAPIAGAIPDIAGYQPGLFLRPYVVLRECCDFDGIDGLEIAPDAISDANLPSSAANFLELLPWAESDAQIAALVELHRRRGNSVEQATANSPLPALVAAKGNGPIRLGFISSDLKRHSVARFVLPLLDHVDGTRFEIYCYSPGEDADDELQRRIRERSAAFRVVGHLSDRELAVAVRADGIDILFELNGFTAESRLTALAWRAAPVQIYWLGYPFTTGIPAVDYLLLDEHMAPRNPDWLAETPLLIRGSFVSYDALETVQPATAPPSERNGFVTFGSLTSPYKITRRSVALWARAMHRLRDSRFLFVHPNYESGPTAANITTAFAHEGIEADQLAFVNNRKTGKSHFQCYADIDVVLDTLPMTGGTTTCDALWMGVPVVTRRGPAIHQRLSHSLLMSCGLGDLSTDTEDAFVDTAVALAADAGRLAALRHDLRDRIRKSTLGDGAAYARNFCELMEGLAVRHGLR